MENFERCQLVTARIPSDSISQTKRKKLRIFLFFKHFFHFHCVAEQTRKVRGFPKSQVALLFLFSLLVLSVTAKNIEFPTAMTGAYLF